MLYPLQQAAPQANLIEANRMAFCKYMKMITLPKLRDSLREMKFEVSVPAADRRARADADRAHGRDRLTLDKVRPVKELAQQLRVDSVRAAAAAGSGHPTSSMSAADLMAVLFTQVPALRLLRPGEHGQRPPRLLQGPRLAAALRALQGGGSDRRR